MSTRFSRVLALFSAVALLTAGVELAATITVRSANNAKLGRIVVNSGGMTLYQNTREKNGVTRCSNSCARNWPPLLVTRSEKVKAGPGINASKFGKVKRPDSHYYQVTYYGKPLYRSFRDVKRGNVNGEGIGGIWFAIKTNGDLAMPSSTGTTTTTVTTSTNPYGY